MLTRALLNEAMQLVGYGDPITAEHEVEAAAERSMLATPRQGGWLVLVPGECDLAADAKEPRYYFDPDAKVFNTVKHQRPDMIVAVYRLIEALDEQGVELPPETRAWFEWTKQRGIEQIRKRPGAAAGEVSEL